MFSRNVENLSLFLASFPPVFYRAKCFSCILTCTPDNCSWSWGLISLGFTPTGREPDAVDQKTGCSIHECLQSLTHLSPLRSTSLPGLCILVSIYFLYLPRQWTHSSSQNKLLLTPSKTEKEEKKYYEHPSREVIANNLNTFTTTSIDLQLRLSITLGHIMTGDHHTDLTPVTYTLIVDPVQEALK